MFSIKELVAFAASIGFGLSYMIFKLSYEMAKNMADQDVAALRNFMLKYQVLVFLLYMALFAVHVMMLLTSKRFMNDPTKDGFDQRKLLEKSSGTLWLFVAISLIMAMFDGLYFLSMWVMQPLEATKFSCFFYWVYRVFNDPIPELSEIAILWQIPLVILEVIFGFIVYKRYYEAKKLYHQLFPAIPKTGIFNVFSTRRNNDDLVFKAPEDVIGSIEASEREEYTEAGSDGDISPLQKHLGNNALFSVDPKPKEKNILKTQQELDSEEDAFFGSAAANPPIKVQTPDKADESDSEQELIPTDFDFSKLIGRPEGSREAKQTDKADKTDKVPCPMCGFLNAGGSRECEFCGTAITTESEQ